ncbi:MAG: hypothetical protein IJ107_05550 [Lachnospiraceae bacterium]|nr:hypothetical protein [Lachnospiraceae bacterium]
MKLRYGKAGENTIDRSITKRISGAGIKSGEVTMSADPVTLKVSGIGELAVYAAVNALSAEKILPESFRPVILLPEGTQEKRLREIMDGICKVCRAENLVIEGGHTEVTAAVTRPVVIGTCTGTAMERGKGNIISPGAGIVMTKWAGMEAGSILACEKEELRNVYPETILMRLRKLREYLSVRPEAQICAREGADCLVDLSEGGIYAALWRLSVKTRRGLRVDMAAIPLLQETIELANYYDIDPYKMRSAGSLLAVTADADALVEALEGSGIPAVKIGELTEDHDKTLINDDEVRYLDLPQTDELHRILDK